MEPHDPGLYRVTGEDRGGDTLLFDSKLPHGTPTNRTADDWRWALQYHYIPISASEVDESVRLQAFGTEGKDVTC